uniref:Minichromosome maintenance domain containing 2 n=1 Tax=Fundulus heteroclitus TaxID=8078 RepID=A0A3Q2NUJ4_FUNHE
LSNKSVLIYLDRSGGLRQLAEDCRPLNDPRQTEAVYRFRVLVNPADLLEVDPGLGDYVLHDPRRATALFQSVCFLAIKTLSLTDKIHTASQVRRTSNCRPVVYHLRFFQLVSKTITQITKRRPDLDSLSLRSFCFLEGFHHIRVHAPGATESATVRNDFSCTICSSQLKEDVKFRVLGDKQLVELIHADALDGLRGHQQSPFRYQSVTLFLRDELCHSMAIGRRYRVVGIPALVHQWPSLTWSVEANRIFRYLSLPTGRHELPSRFLELLGCLASSPWRFPAVVAHCFGSGLSPPGLYNTLKLCLLLSSVQSRTDAYDAFHNLDLLVVTADTLVLDR